MSRLMHLSEIMNQLQLMGNASVKNIYMNHGALEPLEGVKVEDLKKISKKLGKNYQLSLELFKTRNSDAMYLAGMIADEMKMTADDLRQWAELAYWYMLSEYAVATVAAESKYGWELAAEWIKSDKANIASCGWATYSFLLSLTPDEKINENEIRKLLRVIEAEIALSPARVKYTMNGFLIAVGAWFRLLSDDAKTIAGRIGKLDVDMGKTNCRVPDAKSYISKIEKSGKAGIKKKKLRS